MPCWKIKRCLFTLAIALGEGLFTPGVSIAQWFHLGEWQGSYESGHEYARQTTSTTGSPSSRFQSILSDDRLNLENTGAYIVDPKLVTLTFGGTLGLSQSWLASDGQRESTMSSLLGYDFFSNIFPEGAFPLNLFANRNQSTLSGSFPGRTDVVTENRGATLFAKQLYIPSSFAFRQELADEESHSGDLVARHKERRDVLTYEGRRGWVDNELAVKYEFVDLSDEILPELSYRSHEGSLYYGIDFGPELNRHFDSRLRYFTRAGLIDISTLNVDEFLRIDHTPKLQTSYRYSLVRTDVTTGATTNNLASFNLRHLLYVNLTTNLNLDGSIQTAPGGERDQYGGRLDFTYTNRIPWNGRLNIGLGGGLHYNANRFHGGESFVPQESHVAATPFAMPIDLANPFVASGSIVVTKIATGPLPPGCFPPPGPPTPLVLGQDYTVQAFGDITQIVPIPCSGITPGINPGDTIAVDYRFSVSPNLTFLTMPWHFSISPDFGWIRPYYMHEQTDEKLLSGQDGRFLNNERSDTVGTELRYDGQRLRAAALAEFKNYNSERVAYNLLRSNQSLGYSISPDLTLSATADESFISFSHPARDTRTISTRAALSYALNASVFADAFAEIRMLSDSSAPTERVLDTGVQVRWFYGKVEVLPSFQFTDRQRGDTNTTDLRLILRIIRRF